ncbi:MAG: dihydroxyacetone kinase subunit L [Eubacteriales bacterium]|nr:dihydroxyacetone kinase subunit L [Eubacteriales bacterium]
MERITIEQLPALFRSIALQFEKNEELLCEMDSRMGDGDLGLTMRKGFCAMPKILEEMDESDFAKKIRKIGMEMTDIVPSTMGMLMGTGIAFGGKNLAGKDGMDAEGVVLFLEGYSAGIVKRGKCERGDCTVLDAIAAAADEARKAAEEGKNLAGVCVAARDGAEKGAEATREMLPKFGKAAVHRNVALGVMDQGAMAGLLFVKGLTDYILKK